MRKVRAILYALLLVTVLAACGGASSSSSASGTGSAASVPSTSSAGPSSAQSSGAAAGAASATPTSGTCAKAGSVHFAKTKFVLHAGLAFGAFHRYIYKPFQAGTFRSGAAGRTKALVKAGGAGLFMVHELRLAAQDANGDPTLCHLAAPVNALSSAAQTLAAKVKSGQITPGEIAGAAGAVDNLKSQAAKVGANIQDRNASF